MLSKNLILALVVVGALTAGTALVVGFVDGPKDVQTVVDSKCADCPREGTPACCKVAGSCGRHATETAATNAPTDTCNKPACGGCCEPKAEAPSCCGSGCGGQTQHSCETGGGCPSK